MKKLFIGLSVAFAMLVMVSCSSNPLIKNGQRFIDNPSEYNYDKFKDAQDDIEELSQEEYEEFLEWSYDNRFAIEAARWQMYKNDR